MSEVTTTAIADAMYELVKECEGKKKLKPMDLIKAMREKFNCDKKLCKEAMRELIESERCVYTYFGGSYVEIPHVEGAAK